MAKPRLKGKYVPDKDGKLRHILKLTDININLSASPYHKHFTPLQHGASSWYNRIWLWLKNNLF